MNVTFTYTKAQRLKRAYQDALSHNQTRFTFEGRDYLTDYVRYLLEYLEGEFGKPIEG